MRSILPAVVLLGAIITACNPFTKKTVDSPPADTIPVKTAEQLLAEEKVRQDSIKLAES